MSEPNIECITLIDNNEQEYEFVVLNRLSV